jgi:class 3 adenylate cyclase
VIETAELAKPVLFSTGEAGMMAALAAGERHLASAVVLYGSHLDEVLAEVSSFLLGEIVLPAATRTLAAVLFTDLDGSTELATSLGDDA